MYLEDMIGPILIGAAILVVLILFFTFVPLRLYISALAAGVKVNIFTLVGMKLRNVKPARIILPMIKATKAGLDVTINMLETHYLAGGNVDKVIDAPVSYTHLDVYKRQPSKYRQHRPIWGRDLTVWGWQCPCTTQWR